MTVTWDRTKNLANQRKHGIAFEEAKQLFTAGRDYLEIFDETHSEYEDRFIVIGPVARGLIQVVFVDRDDDTLRIVSARWASQREARLYDAYQGSRR